MHQIQFRLGLRPRPHWGSPLAGWVGLAAPLQEPMHPALGPSGFDTAFFRDPTILAPINQKVKLPICAKGSSPELVPPLFRPTLRSCSLQRL